MSAAATLALLYVAVGVSIGWIVALLAQRAAPSRLLLPSGLFVALLLILRFGLDTREALQWLAARPL